MTISKWTPEKEVWLKDNFNKKTIKQCIKHLLLKSHVIRYRAKSLGLERFDDYDSNSKVCRKCQNQIPKTEFSKKSDSRDGLSSICNNCQKIKADKDYLNRDKDKMAKQAVIAKINRTKDPIKCREFRLKLCLNYAKRRALKKGIDFDLDYKWINSNTKENCPVFDVPFNFASFRKGRGAFNEQSKFSPSIDRLDNNKGYTKENCVIISVKANLLKGKSSLKDLQSLVSFLQKSTL